ncbi:MAG: transporter [Alphaproteobacteria bacterium]|nr:transporter [Alphaproteobacteria bacterium]
MITCRYKFIIITALCFLIVNSFKIQNSQAKDLRPLSSERPSKTDSALTINRFHSQIETSFYSKTFDTNSKNNTKSNIESYSEYLTIRFGISDSSEIQYIFDGVSFYKKTQNQNIYYNQTGSSGEKFIRLKHNILGNDEGKIGLAVTPFFKIDNAQDRLLRNDLRGGIVAPFHYKLSDEITIGGMYQINYYKTSNSLKKNQYVGFVNSYYISKSFNERLSSYIEFYSLKTFSHNKFLRNYLDFGTNYLVSKNIKLDFGINFGLSESANDLNYLSGITWRF